MRFSQLVLLTCVARSRALSVSNIQSGQTIRYSGLSFSTSNSSVPIYATNGTFTIKRSKSTPGVVVLDYGINVEGFPTFQVLSAIGDTSGLEITYSESREVLDNHYMVCASPEVSSVYVDSNNRVMGLSH